MKIRCRILFNFHRRINFISTLIHNFETTLIQCWNVGWDISANPQSSQLQNLTRWWIMKRGTTQKVVWTFHHVVIYEHGQIKEQYISILKRLIVTILDRLVAYDNGLLHKKLHDLWSCGHFKSSDKWKLISLHIHDTHGNQTWQGGGLWHGASTRNVAWSFDTVNTISDWQSLST